MSLFSLPDLGEGLQEAEIVAWHVAVGEHVVADQPLLSVETEKALVEIPSPRSGRILRLLAEPGQRVKVGTGLLEFEAGVHPEVGTVVGELPKPPPAVTPQGGRPAPARSRPSAAPAVRARARELGVDLASIVPSGPDGTITLTDLGRVAATTDAAARPLHGARRSMALNMARAGREVVPASLHEEADIEAWPANEDVTRRLIRAIVAACLVEPALNSRFDSTTLCLHVNPRVDVGLAIDSPEGLFVPVIRDAAGISAAEQRMRIDELKKAVADRTLTPAQMRDPTITLSNFGTIGGLHASLVIVPPQVAILGVGRIRALAVGTPQGIDMHGFLPVSLTFDHRAISGGEAVRFLRVVIADLERAI